MEIIFFSDLYYEKSCMIVFNIYTLRFVSHRFFRIKVKYLQSNPICIIFIHRNV